MTNVENLIGEFGCGGTVVSESGLLCKGSFRSCNTFSGEMAIPVDTDGFGRTCYTRTIADEKIMDVDRPASCDSASWPHRDDESELSAERLSGDPPRRGPGCVRSANLELAVAAFNCGPNTPPLTLPVRYVWTMSEN